MYCILYLHGAITPEDHDALCAHLGPEATQQEHGLFEFSQESTRFPYEDLMETLSLSWIWHNSSDIDTIPGVLCYDAERNEHFDAPTVEQDLVVAVRTLDDAEHLADLKRWQAFWSDARLEVVTSAHARIALRARMEERRRDGARALPWAKTSS